MALYKINDFKDYQNQYDLSLKDPENFWGKIAENFHWFKSWERVKSGNFHDVDFKWFVGGKTNMSYNCLDRHIPKRGDQTALIFEPNSPDGEKRTFTYKELLNEVENVASSMTELGIKKGDIVCFYMSQVPELLISLLACCRIGAIHSVVFAGFSATSLAGRINDCKAKWLFTNDGGLRGEKVVPLKKIADEALKDCTTVSKTIVYKHAHNEISFDEKQDVWWSEFIKLGESRCEAQKMDSEDPLFILYTSGSTGKPKGQLHTTGGYMVYAAYTFQNVFQVNPSEDVYWCTADIGWITGHTYLTYGPLLNGATTLMFEGVPTYPDAGRFWEICDKYKVTHFYTAPTAIRALQAMDISFVEKHTLDSLKVLGTVGEPINQEAWDWYHENIGKKKCPIVDTWWQTETGGIMISTLAGVTEPKPCYATYPLPGIVPVLVDENGAEKPFISGKEESGNLCIKNPWPGQSRSIYGDHDRFIKTYFSTYKGYYFTGDGAKRDGEGRLRITGRVDDVINVSGHRMGTAEVENAIDEHPFVIEAAVVGYPHEIKGEGIYAYVICSKEKESENESEMRKEILSLVNKVIGPIAKPDKIQFVKGLPKTRSGKIMRRILRKVASSEYQQLGDTSTLIDPSVVGDLIEGSKQI
jgi:acetyl-CoA synthetase